ncbi:MAG: hypothetical protein NTY53_23955 [Kiritimatiellaeota bacterium]|nr:hypothetical protein [Kiritimatiellota bacterium]
MPTKKAKLKRGVCKVCGCTEFDPCVYGFGETCAWTDATETLCTCCADKTPRVERPMKSLWTYIKYDAKGDYLPGEKKKLPPPGTAYLAFESLRWRVVIGFTEPGGQSSILYPNVTDDCNVIAFAPLSEQRPPDMKQIRASCPWKKAAYKNYTQESVNLLR